MKLLWVILFVLLLSCEDNSIKTCAEQNLDEVYISDTKVNGIQWFYLDNTCIVDSTSLLYDNQMQGKSFIAEVNGIFSVYQTVGNSNPVEHYVADTLNQDWISFKGDSLIVTNPSDSCFWEYPEYFTKDENGNCSLETTYADLPKKKHYYNCSDYPSIYIIGCKENSPK